MPEPPIRASRRFVPTSLRPPVLSLVFAAASLTSTVAQSGDLRAYFPFDAWITDSTGSLATAFSGGSPAYAQDRNGTNNRAINLDGVNDYVTLMSAASPGDSNAALGLKGEFTVSAWMRMDDATQAGDNMIVGNLGSGTGTLHYGVRNNGTPVTHYGMWGNDAAGQVQLESQNWYHVVYAFADGNQEMFLNGIPETVRAASNTTRVADALIGTAGGTNRAFDGRLDDVAFFAGRLSAAQIQALADGVAPDALPENYFADPVQGELGGAGTWGIREIRNHPLAETSVVNAGRVARAASGGTASTGSVPLLNFADPQNNGGGGNFSGDIPFITDSGGDDNGFVTVAHGAVQIATEGDYTFGFASDDGSLLRIFGQQFVSSTVLNGALRAATAHQGDSLVVNNGPSSALGVVHLSPGIYPIEYLSFENTGGAYAEVFAAPGARNALDGNFRLVGDTAGGGLPLVAQPALVRTFSSDVDAIVAGNPSQLTLSWDTFFADSVSIDQGIPAISGDRGSVIVAAPATTTTYTFSAARAGAQTTTAEVTVFVDPPAVIDSFVADDTEVAPGAPVTLSWETRFASGLTIQPGNLDVSGMTSVVVNPSSTTMYTLTATGGGGNASAQVTVTVGQGPVISTFTADDLQPEAEPTVRLDWAVSDFDTLTLDNGIGDVTALDHTFVCPVTTTTYVLTATNTFGSTTASVTVSPTASIGIDPAGRFTVEFAYPLAAGNLAGAESTLAGGVDLTIADSAFVNYADNAGGSVGEIINDVAFPASLPDTFALRATALLVVNVGGNYTFGINNDDGGRLRIGGANVIVDDAQHAALSTTGSITLSPGSYPIEYLMFDSGGGAAAELTVRDPSGVPLLLTAAAAAPPIVTATVIVNEFMASNDGEIIRDGDGDSEDWIELYNGTGATVSLDDYYLTDSIADLRKWQFPAGTSIAPGEFLLVWASDKGAAPPAGEIHTSFKLSAGGEYLALVRADGAANTVVSEFAPTFPPQSEGVSYGSYDVDQFTGYFVAPTPLSRNAFGYAGLVADTKFPTSTRGFKDAPFDVTITTDTPGATILYTLDGSEPAFKDGGNGLVYTGPITVDATTVIRVRAEREGFFPTNIDTQSYIFVDDVVEQDDAHALGLGFPGDDDDTKGQVFEYGMDPAVIAAREQEVKDALLAIPTFSLVIDQERFSGPDRGIYVNALDIRGLEQPASLELLNEDGLLGGQFQENLGVRIRGGFSRSDANPKHAFRFFFRGIYGAKMLDYPIFQDEGADSFDKFDLRTSQNNSWAFQNSNRNSFIREVFGRDTQRDMGEPYTRSRYYHLYINGHYWGLYQTQERAEADYGETYFGGDESDYDTIKSAGSSAGYTTEATDGDFDGGDWRALWNGVRALRTSSNKTADYYALQGLAPDGVTPIAAPVLLDPDNLIDYMIDVFYTGAFDTALSTFIGASNNWFSVRNRVADDRGFAFFYHDGEHGMGTDRGNGGTSNTGLPNDQRSTDRTGPYGGNGQNFKGENQYGSINDFNRSNPQYLHEDLATVEEYRIRFADRAYQHLVAAGGALTPEQVEARIAAREATVAASIRAEQARWGNNTNLTKEAWMTEIQALRDWIRNGSNQATNLGRENVLIAQFRAYSDGGALPLFPDAVAPTFNQQGGFVPTGFELVLTDENPGAGGTIYFTTDGSDPRAAGGGLGGSAMVYSGPVTLTASVPVRARSRDNGQWSPLNEAVFIVGTAASAATLVVSEINYHPADPTPAEAAEAFITDDGDFEFLEFHNISTTEVLDLSNVVVSGEIDYTFPVGTTLPAGERIFIVSNQQAFDFRYSGFVPVPQALGQYTRRLGNGGGPITVTGAGGGEIFSFAYDDTNAWPNSADGDGYTLVLACSGPAVDHGDPANWRSSHDLLGTPGTGEGIESFSEWLARTGATGLPESDSDADGIPLFMEFYLGGDPAANSAHLLPVVEFEADSTQFVYRRSVTAAGTTARAEFSTDLIGWDASSGAIEIDETNNLGDGTEEVVARSVAPTSTSPQQFFRLRVTEK